VIARGALVTGDITARTDARAGLNGLYSGYPMATRRAASLRAGLWSVRLRSNDRRVAQVATDLVLVPFRWRQELGTPGAPFGVHRLDVFDLGVEDSR